MKKFPHSLLTKWKKNLGWNTLFPPNWNKSKKYTYKGADDKPILPFSIVEFTLSGMNPKLRKKYAKEYPWEEGERLLFLSEIRFADGHCVVADRAGKIHWMYHTDNFRMLTEEEV